MVFHFLDIVLPKLVGFLHFVLRVLFPRNLSVFHCLHPRYPPSGYSGRLITVDRKHLDLGSLFPLFELTFIVIPEGSGNLVSLDHLTGIEVG